MPTKAEARKRVDDEIAIVEAKYLGKLVRNSSLIAPLKGVVTEVGVYGRDVDRSVSLTHPDYSRIILRLDGGTWRWLIRQGDTSSKWEVYDG